MRSVISHGVKIALSYDDTISPHPHTMPILRFGKSLGVSHDI